MKTTTKIILAAAFVSTLGISGLARTASATQSRSVMLQPHSNTQKIAEASDGDGEQNDATEPPEMQHPHSEMNSVSSIPIKVPQVREHTDSKKGAEHVKQSQSSQGEDVNDAPNDADSTHEDAQ